MPTKGDVPDVMFDDGGVTRYVDQSPSKYGLLPSGGRQSKHCLIWQEIDKQTPYYICHSYFQY